MVYDLDWNEDERFSEWRAVFSQTEDVLAVLRAAILSDAWNEIEPLQHAPWLGPLLVAALLRQNGTTQNHLACLNVGARTIPRERRRARDRTARILAFLDAIHEAANTGLKEHDRLALAREQMQRRLKRRRSSSKLPQLIDLVLARPLVFTTMIQKELKVTRQGALNLVGDLNLREMTGRKRFQAWGSSDSERARVIPARMRVPTRRGCSRHRRGQVWYRPPTIPPFRISPMHHHGRSLRGPFFCRV